MNSHVYVDMNEDREGLTWNDREKREKLLLSNSGYESKFYPILQILRMLDDESNCVDVIQGVVLAVG